jgi:hypothetical protein
MLLLTPLSEQATMTSLSTTCGVATEHAVGTTMLQGEAMVSFMHVDKLAMGRSNRTHAMGAALIEDEVMVASMHVDELTMGRSDRTHAMGATLLKDLDMVASMPTDDLFGDINNKGQGMAFFLAAHPLLRLQPRPHQPEHGRPGVRRQPVRGGGVGHLQQYGSIQPPRDIRPRRHRHDGGC